MKISIKREHDPYVKQDNNIIFAMCVLMFVPSINNFLNTILQKYLVINIVVLTPIAYIFMAFCSVFFLYRYAFKIRNFLVVFVFFVLGVVISYILYPEIRTVIYASPIDLVYSPVNKLIFFCLPAMGGMMFLTNYHNLFEKMQRWGEITLVIGVCSYLLVFFVAGQSLQYMVFSYFMLLPICVCFEHANIKKSKIDFALAIIGSECILMCGARGACVSLVLYFIARGISNFSRMVTLRSFTKFLFLIILGIMLTIFHTELLKLVSDLFDELGVNSRVIQKLISDEIFDDNSRNVISNSIWQGLRNNPLGYGVFGDRYVIGISGYGSYTYAHNIVTELLCSFGYFGGGIALVVLFAIVGRKAFLSKEANAKYLIITLLPYGLFQLFFSSSYLENLVFWAILGLCLNVSSGHNHKNTDIGMH